MLRRLLFLSGFLMVVAGCSNSSTSGPGSSSDSDGDPNATYTIKLREPQAGEKYQTLRTGSTFSAATRTVKGQPKSEENRAAWRFEYTDEILEIKDPKERPTKARHLYTSAERVINGKTIPASFQNKTVAIDRSGSGYNFRVEKGGKLTPEDLKYFSRLYNTKPRMRPQELIPDRAVRVGEPWQVAQDIIVRMFKDEGRSLDENKTTGSGKLAKVYQKDGRQFGVIEFRFEIYPLEIVEGSRKTTLKPGSRIVVELRADTCIDGTAAEASVTNRSVGDLIVSQGAEVKLSIDESDTVTGKLIQ